MKIKHRLISKITLGTVMGAAILTACGTQAKTPNTPLTQDEVKGLLHMVEEEKLAGDVYQTLYGATKLQNFANIVQSERRHQSAIQGLLKEYNIQDPTEGKALGEFTHPELTTLYKQLTAQGAQSNEQALKVGALIEELDIADLNKLIAHTTRDNILRVYSNLNRGSRNHLRSFDSTLKAQTAKTYTPQHLSQSEYDAVINGTHEKGNGHGDGHGKGKGQGKRTQF